MDMVYCTSKVKVVLKEHPHIRGGTKWLKNKNHSTLEGGTRGHHLKDIGQILKSVDLLKIILQDYFCKTI